MQLAMGVLRRRRLAVGTAGRRSPAVSMTRTQSLVTLLAAWSRTFSLVVSLLLLRIRRHLRRLARLAVRLNLLFSPASSVGDTRASVSDSFTALIRSGSGSSRRRSHDQSTNPRKRRSPPPCSVPETRPSSQFLIWRARGTPHRRVAFRPVAAVPARRRARGYERLDRAGQIGQGFPDGNQPVALTLHALFSHARQTRPAGDEGRAI